MNTKQLSRIFARAMYGMIIVAMVFSVTGVVHAQDEPVPWFTVFPEQGAVEGWNWPLGSEVRLTIDDLNTKDVNPDYSSEPVAVIITPWDTESSNTWVWFEFEYMAKPGDVVTVSLYETGEMGQIHVVQNLTITEIDEGENTVYGTADGGQHIILWSWEDPEGRRIETDADGSGNWGVDFDDIGFDLEPGFHVRAEAWVGDNDTAVDREVPEPPVPPVPFIWADPVCECVNGWDWGDGDEITIEVFDQDGNQFPLKNSTRSYSTDDGVFFNLGEDEDIDVQPGYRVTMSNGSITKELIVSPLVVKEMNPVANTISGIYDPSLDLVIYTGDQDPISLEFDSDRWVAAFETMGGSGEVYQPDEDGDKTGMGWDGVPDFLRYDIYALDDQSLNAQRITTLDGAGEYNPSWSPDGSKIAHDVVYWDGSQSIFITDVNSGTSTPLIGAEDGGNDAAWAPNGQLIAFDRRWVGDESIYVVPLAGGETRLVRNDAVSPDWSPVGMRMVFQQPSDESIRVMNFGGNNESLVAPSGQNPVWSPDGNWIAYESEGDIWKIEVNINGIPLGEPIQLTSGPFIAGQPTWSADGQYIIYHSGETEDYDLWKVPADGGNALMLYGATEHGDYDPTYFRNGTNIAYAGFTP